jgi:hypothetical protein
MQEMGVEIPKLPKFLSVKIRDTFHTIVFWVAGREEQDELVLRREETTGPSIMSQGTIKDLTLSSYLFLMFKI